MDTAQIFWANQIFIYKKSNSLTVVKIIIYIDNSKFFWAKFNGKFSFQTKWYFNAHPLIGQDKAILKLINIQLQHTGVYKCVVGNLHGTIARQFTLDVLGLYFTTKHNRIDIRKVMGRSHSSYRYTKLTQMKLGTKSVRRRIVEKHGSHSPSEYRIK